MNMYEQGFIEGMHKAEEVADQYNFPKCGDEILKALVKWRCHRPQVEQTQEPEREEEGRCPKCQSLLKSRGEGWSKCYCSEKETSCDHDFGCNCKEKHAKKDNGNPKDWKWENNVKKDELAERLRGAYDGHYFDTVEDEARKWAVEVMEKCKKDNFIFWEDVVERLKGEK